VGAVTFEHEGLRDGRDNPVGDRRSLHWVADTGQQHDEFVAAHPRHGVDGPCAG
jgi:hypothetical protein